MTMQGEGAGRNMEVEGETRGKPGVSEGKCHYTVVLLLPLPKPRGYHEFLPVRWKIQKQKPNKNSECMNG